MALSLAGRIPHSPAAFRAVPPLLGHRDKPRRPSVRTLQHLGLGLKLEGMSRVSPPPPVPHGPVSLPVHRAGAQG